jgi:hypothetical protein
MYHDPMMDNIDEVSRKRLKALKDMNKDTVWVAQPYNKEVKNMLFQVDSAENHTTNWSKEQHVWQEVTKLGGSL